MTGKRHPVLRGFEETDIVPYGGTLVPLRVDSGAIVPLTFIPPFSTYPPETSWMRVLKIEVPGLVLSGQGPSRIAFSPPTLIGALRKSICPAMGIYWRTSCGGLVVPAFRCRWKGQA